MSMGTVFGDRVRRAGPVSSHAQVSEDQRSAPLEAVGPAAAADGAVYWVWHVSAVGTSRRPGQPVAGRRSMLPLHAARSGIWPVCGRRPGRGWLGGSWGQPTACSRRHSANSKHRPTQTDRTGELKRRSPPFPSRVLPVSAIIYKRVTAELWEP